MVALFTTSENVNALGVEFSTTSSMAVSGSNLSAGENFSYQTADQYYNSSVRPSMGRRLGSTDDSDDGDSEYVPGQDWDKPESENDPLPIGDAVPFLLLLAIGYAGWKKLQRLQEQ